MSWESRGGSRARLVSLAHASDDQLPRSCLRYDWKEGAQPMQAYGFYEFLLLFCCPFFFPLFFTTSPHHTTQEQAHLAGSRTWSSVLPAFPLRKENEQSKEKKYRKIKIKRKARRKMVKTGQTIISNPPNLHHSVALTAVDRVARHHLLGHLSLSKYPVVLI